MWSDGLATVAGLLLAVVATAAHAQSIDISRSRLRLGEPIALQVRVQPGDLPAGRRFSSDCVHAEIEFGTTLLGPQDLQTRSRPDGSAFQVTLSHAEELTEPIVLARIEIRCGPSYAREFTILADEPTAERATAPRPPSVPPPTRAAARRSTGHKHSNASAAGPLPSADPPASTTSRPSPPIDDRQLGMLAQAVLLLLRTTPHETGAGPAALNSPGAIPDHAAPPDRLRQSLLDELDRLHAEQGRTSQAVNMLLARVEHQDQQRWTPLAWLAGSVLLTLWLSWLTPAVWRTVGTRLLRPSASAPTRKAPSVSWVDALPEPPPIHPTPHSATPFAAPAAADRHQVASPHSAAPMPTEHAIDTAGATPWNPLELDESSWRPPETSRAEWPEAAYASPRTSAWPAADFGAATLEDTELDDLLDQMETQMAQGYAGACAIALEQALHNGTGKPARVLLRLLDIYRHLDQPWNHERVCAQLEALYNVSAPAMNEGQPADPGLDEMPDLLRGLTRIWSQPDCAEAIGQLLLRPSIVPPFGLAAFQDLLLLHSIAGRSATPPEPFGEAV